MLLAYEEMQGQPLAVIESTRSTTRTWRWSASAAPSPLPWATA
jgi:hypothetical protein